MKKLSMLFIMFVAAITLSACGGDDEPDVTDLAGRYMGQTAFLFQGEVGEEIIITLVEYDSVLATTIMDLESYVDERVAYFFTYDYVEGDGSGYGSVYFSFTYDLDEADPEPDTTAFTVALYEDVEEFDAAKTEIVDDIENFMDQSQTLADAIEAEGEEITFEMNRVQGEFDASQVEDFLEEELEDDDDDE